MSWQKSGSILAFDIRRASYFTGIPKSAKVSFVSHRVLAVSLSADEAPVPLSAIATKC
jgi:hypothetical protein